MKLYKKLLARYTKLFPRCTLSLTLFLTVTKANLYSGIPAFPGFLFIPRKQLRFVFELVGSHIHVNNIQLRFDWRQPTSFYKTVLLLISNHCLRGCRVVLWSVNIQRINMFVICIWRFYSPTRRNLSKRCYIIDKLYGTASFKKNKTLWADKTLHCRTDRS